MNNTTFDTKIAQLNSELDALRGVTVSAPSVAKSSPTAAKARADLYTDRLLIKKAKQLPYEFGQKDLPSTLRLIKKLAGVQLRAVITPRMREKMIVRFSKGDRPRAVAEKFGVSIATANVIRMNAGLNKRRVLQSA